MAPISVSQKLKGIGTMDPVRSLNPNNAGNFKKDRTVVFSLKFKATSEQEI